jgi:tetratricopeptide (TPR) repeat protein
VSEHAEHEKRTAEARGLEEQLLQASPVQRAEMARSVAFRNLDLAELLLKKAEVSQPQDLRRSDELARLAFVIAEPVNDESQAGRANRVKARACVLAGNVHRLRRQQEDAETMFRKAVFHLTGPPDCEERAFYCWNLALLRQGQGQLDEAVGLLWRAALIYRENGERRREGLCLSQLGFLFLEEDQAGRAVPPLTQACQSLEPASDPVAYARCALALAWCHALLGEAGKSRCFLEPARSLQGSLPAGEPRAVAAWFEGRMAALSGRPEEASRLLEEARREFLEAGDLYAAARASLELGRVWAERGEWERLERLPESLGSPWQTDLSTIGVLFILMTFVEALRRGMAPAEAVGSAVSRLRCCRRDSVLALGYWPPELNGSKTWDGSDFDPSLSLDTPELRLARLIER